MAPNDRRTPEAFLRIPPFPRARLRDFAKKRGRDADLSAVAAALRELRVGGSYWGAQPELPPEHVLVRSGPAVELVRELMPERSLVLWDSAGKSSDHLITGECDPWHMLSGATALVAQADDELCLIAALLGVPCYEFDPDRRTVEALTLDPAQMIDEADGSSATSNTWSLTPIPRFNSIQLRPSSVLFLMLSWVPI